VSGSFFCLRLNPAASFDNKDLFRFGADLYTKPFCLLAQWFQYMWFAGGIFLNGNGGNGSV